MNGQPSPYSDDFSVRQDARRFQMFLLLTMKTISEMSPEEKAVWNRIIVGGWFVDDLVARIDALIVLQLNAQTVEARQE